MFRMTFNTNNDAFSEYCEEMVARILRDVADSIESGINEGSIRDFNGNTIGSYLLEVE